MELWSEYAKLKTAYRALYEARLRLPRYTRRTALDDELDRLEALLEETYL